MRLSIIAAAFAAAFGTLLGAQAAAVERTVRETFDIMDQNGDGVIDTAEFRINKMRIFRLSDVNGDNYLTREEATVSPEAFDAADIDRDGRLSGFEWIDSDFTRFERADRDSDGFITFEEFQVFVESITGGQRR